jgi:dienelactone hydrolase
VTDDVLTRLRSTLDIGGTIPEGLSKVWIYKGRILAADYRSPNGAAFAFDITVEDSVATVAVAARDERSRDVIRAACEGLVESVPGTRKLRLGSVDLGAPDAADGLLDPMQRAHQAIFQAEVARSSSVEEATWTHDGVDVNYVRRAPKEDCDQIVVIFTSIRTVPTDLDFDGPEGKYLASNRAELVFVHDDHDEAFCYYYGTGRDDQVARAVTAFVRDLARQRGVGLDRVVLAGMSKGGAAALIIGARLPGATVLSLVPQLAIGTYLLGRSEPYLETIAGSRSDEAVAWLDTVVPQALAGATNVDGAYYVLTSPGDDNCFDGLAEHAAAAGRLRNLQVISAASPRASDHFRTLKYLLPTMISILGVLSAGVRPVFGPVSTTSARSVVTTATRRSARRPLRLRAARLRRELQRTRSEWREASAAV